MTFLSWRDDYRVGVPIIDTEHRYIFALINEFHENYASGRTQVRILRVLNRLVAYAEDHFRHEETLMQSCGYPRLAQQHQEHEKLFSSIFELNEKLSIGTARIDAETLRFLKHWILDHILREDLDIGDFIRRKAAQEKKAAQKEDEERQKRAAAERAEEAADGEDASPAVETPVGTEAPRKAADALQATA